MIYLPSSCIGPHAIHMGLPSVLHPDWNLTTTGSVIVSLFKTSSGFVYFFNLCWALATGQAVMFIVSKTWIHLLHVCSSHTDPTSNPHPLNRSPPPLTQSPPAPPSLTWTSGTKTQVGLGENATQCQAERFSKVRGWWVLQKRQALNSKTEVCGTL